MFDRLDDVTLLIVNTASVVETEVVVCDAPLATSSTVLVVPVNAVPVTLTVQAFVVVEYSDTMPVTVGIVPEYVHAQVSLGTQTASSEVFRKVIILPEVPAVLLVVVSTLHWIWVALVLVRKQSLLPTAPSVLICTGLSVIYVPKFVPVIVTRVPP